MSTSYPQARENYDVCVYAPDDDNFDAEGLCGPIDAISCVQTEEAVEAGGMDEITLVAAYDAQGKWRYLINGNILRVYVQKRVPPEIDDNGGVVTAIERWTVKSGASKANRYVYSKKSGGKKLKLLSAGTEVIVTSAPASGRYTVRTAKANGYMAPAGLTYSRTEQIPDRPNGIEAALPGAQIMAQLYDIQRVHPGENDVTVYARHISYRLRKNSASWGSDSAVTMQQAGRGILAACEVPTDAQFFSDIADTRIGLRWKNVNPIHAFFDPESGLASKWRCEVLRDNEDIYMLSTVGVDRGVCVEPGKNLAGVEIEENIENIYTRIKPIGRKKDGTELLLEEVYVVSDNEISYPYPMLCVLECKDCTVGKNGNTTQVRAEMRRQAQALLDGGIDAPEVSMRVQLIQTDGLSGMEIIEQLEPMLIYDLVRVLTPMYRMIVAQRVLRRQWDCLHGRLIAIETGMTEDLSRVTFPGWQIPDLSGAKILRGTMGAEAMADEVISTRHMQAESINADAIASGSVTTPKLAAGAVTAENIASGVIDAGMLAAINAIIRNLDAGSGDFDRLDAAFAQMQTLIAGTATLDAATVGHLVSSVFNLDGSGTFEDAYIYNLILTYAQMASAIVGNLALKGDDGHYYRISVSNGQLAPVLIPDAEIDAQSGMTADGTRALVDSALSQLDMTSGPTIKGLVGVINRIYASVIDVGTLLARQAFVDALYTSQIFGGESLAIIAGRASEGSRNYLRGSRSLADAEQIMISGVYQTGNILHIVGDVSVTQSGSVLHIS